MKLAVDGKGQLVPAGRVNDPTGGSGYEGDPGGPTGGPPTDSGGTVTSSAPTTSTPVSSPTDWSSMLGLYGLPSDVAAKVSQIFTQTGDVNQAVQLALAYVRGTDWYAKTYPGIQEGIARGVVSNEADYRAYVNQVHQLNQQYYGTDISSQQVADYLKAGYSVQHVGQLFQGHAYATANRNDVNYLLGAFGDGALSDADLEKLGQENAGLDSAVGQKLQNAVQKASQRMHTIFSGTLAAPSLSLSGGGLASPSLAGRSGPPDVGA